LLLFLRFAKRRVLKLFFTVHNRKPSKPFYPKKSFTTDAAIPTPLAIVNTWHWTMFMKGSIRIFLTNLRIIALPSGPTC
jgi:hypothetical protein